MSNNRFDLETGSLSPVAHNTARLRYISTAKYGGDWHSIPHTHGCAELFYVVSGRGQFHLPGGLVPVEQDDLVIVSPQVEHTEVSLNASPLEYIVLGVEGMDFVTDAMGEKRYGVFSFRTQREEILFYLRGILHEIEDKQAGYDLVCQDLLEICLTKLMRNVEFSFAPTPVHRSSKECANVKRYIDTHFKENLSLDTRAELVHVNKYYLVHSFSKEYQISPINYLIERRIRESCFLLEGTNHSLSQIAQMLGFSSPSYFSQSFRRMQGMNPMEYRKRCRAAQQAQAGQPLQREGPHATDSIPLPHSRRNSGQK